MNDRAFFIGPKGPVTQTLPNWMNFRKNSKRPSTPPHFRNIILQFFFPKTSEKNLFGLEMTPPDLTLVNLALKGVNSKLLDVVSVSDVYADERVDDSSVEILKLRYGRDFEPES